MAPRWSPRARWSTPPCCESRLTYQFSIDMIFVRRMETVTLSSKYQLVVPRGARERLRLPRAKRDQLLAAKRPPLD